MSDHYIVKDRVHCYRCQKCGRVGEVSDIKQVVCTLKESTESIQPSSAQMCQVLKNEEYLLRSLVDEQLSLALMEEEMNLLQATEMLQEMEDQALQEAVALSMEELPGCEVRRATNTDSLADMQVLIDMGFTKENAIWAVKISSNLQEAQNHAAARAQAEAAFAKRDAKKSTVPKPHPKPKKAPAKKDENPFDLPPDPDQRRLFELPGVRKRVHPMPAATSTWHEIFRSFFIFLFVNARPIACSCEHACGVVDLRPRCGGYFAFGPWKSGVIDCECLWCCCGCGDLNIGYSFWRRGGKAVWCQAHLPIC